jgi:NAD-dependent dihydropyrimidine dehydrogenase PreA subunit
MKTILYCECAYYSGLVPADKRQAVRAALAECAANVVMVADLCSMAAAKDPALAALKDSEELTVIACQPRAARWLFHAGGASLAGRKIEFLDMRTQSAGEIVARISASGRGKGKDKGAPEKPAGDWIPWFPVIDYSRCKNCKQCLSFCLFGVYEADEKGRMVVKNPRKCKTNCPACARICPEVAIIFAKCTESPINGAEITDEETARANVKVNLDKILGSDPYKALAMRQKQAKMRLVDRDKLKHD